MSTDGKSTIAATLFKTGSDAVTKSNWDYAIDCFLKAVKLVPDRLSYRQALRAATKKKYNDNKKGATMAALRMKSIGVKLSLAERRKDWVDVLANAEDALLLNPWDADMNMKVAEACRQLEWFEMGIWNLEAAVEGNANHAPLFRALADLYEQIQQYRKAVTALERVARLDPKDSESLSKARALEAQETIQRGRYEDQNTGPVVKSAVASENEEAPLETPEARQRRELEQQEKNLAKDPENAQLAIQIADGYRRLGELDKAIAHYKKAVEISQGRDPDVKIKLAECEIEPYRRKLAALKEKLAAAVKANATDKAKEIKEQVSKFNAEVVKREARLYKIRIEANEEDYEAYYELGYRLLQLKDHDGAIKAFQHGRNDARHKWEALMWLGYSFWQKKNQTLADKNLADALAAAGENEDARKQILYYRGRVAEDNGNRDSAKEFFNEIASLDYGYKDVAKRLDELNQG